MRATTLLALLTVACSQNIPQSATVSVRKKITCMTSTERDAYLQAYKAVTTPENPNYQDVKYLIDLHGSSIPRIHTLQYFLVWHRWFLILFERILQRVNPSVTIPYWEYEDYPNNPLGHSPFDSQTFGGNGTGFDSCVIDGPFAWPSWVPASKTTCLQRTFARDSLLPIALQLTLAFTTASQSATPYITLSNILESVFHNNVHSTIRGEMLTNPSPNAPEFFPLHANLDRVWDLWQNMAPNNMYSYPFPDVPMPFFRETVLPSQVASSTGLGVRYEGSNEINDASHSSCNYIRLNRGWFYIHELERQIITAPYSTMVTVPHMTIRAVPLSYTGEDVTGVTMPGAVDLLSQASSTQDSVDSDRFFGMDLNRAVDLLTIQPVCPATATSCGVTNSQLPPPPSVNGVSAIPASLLASTQMNMAPPLNFGTTAGFNSINTALPSNLGFRQTNLLPTQMFNRVLPTSMLPPVFNQIPVYNQLPMYNPTMFEQSPFRRTALRRG